MDYVDPLLSHLAGLCVVGSTRTDDRFFLGTAAVILVLLGLVFILRVRRSKGDSERLESPQIETAHVNNRWFRYTDSDTVLVFVHGILSDSDRCWTYRNKRDPSQNRFWPELVAGDSRFGKIGIYLGGYASGLNSGNYNVKNCADELFGALGRPDDEHMERRCPLEQRNIIFVCHSMGGIVVRHLLINRREYFQDKKVGLVLIASPSYGSRYANGLEPLTDIYNNEQGRRLKEGDPTLQELNELFRELGGKLPKLAGIELYETQNLLGRLGKWNPFSSRGEIVSKRSAVTHFKGRGIPHTDHWNICTPRSRRDLVHAYLFDFLRDEGFLPPSEGGENKKGELDRSTKIESTTIVQRTKRLGNRSDLIPWSLRELSATMSNPKYDTDILKVDVTWNVGAVIDLETVIIVVGILIVSELLDRPVAEKLRDRIDEEGGIYPNRRGVILSDKAWYAEKALLKNNPVISIGGPKANLLSDEFDKWIPTGPSGEGKYSQPGAKGRTGFFRRNVFQLPQVGLWGESAAESRKAVEYYMGNPSGLSEFLQMCWKPRQQ